MKKILFFLFAGTIVAFSACNDDKSANGNNTGKDSASAAGSSEMSGEAKEERNKKTALASIEDGINKHDPNAVMKDAAANAVDYGDGSMEVHSADSIKASLTQWFAAFPDVKGENLKAVADGDWVMVWGDWSGTWKGDLMGQKATGKSYKVKDVDVFRFNDEGKITEHHNVQSGMAVGMQVGMKMR